MKISKDMEIKKAMISQPMAGKSEDEIVSTRDRAVEVLKARGFEVVNTYFKDEWDEQKALVEPLFFLAKSLESMSKCHAVYFCKDWERARGCRIEHQAAAAYGLELIYDNGEE